MDKVLVLHGQSHSIHKGDLSVGALQDGLCEVCCQLEIALELRAVVLDLAALQLHRQSEDVFCRRPNYFLYLVSFAIS